MREALGDVTVIDLTNSVAGNFCSRLMWTHGAGVTLVEPPGGSDLRRLGPAAEGRDQTGEAPLFRHLNAGKRSVVVDRTTGAGQEALRGLLADADVVLCTTADPAWTDGTALPERVIECRIDEFSPATGYRDWRGSELIHQALSGVMSVTGRPDREPLYGLGYRAYYAAGVTAYITVMAAIVERRETGLGQRVATNVNEASAAMGQNLVTQYGYNGTFATRRRYPGMLSLLRCSDAWVVLFALRSWAGLCEAFEVPELFADPRFANPVSRSANWPEATDALAKSAIRFTADELVDRAQQRKVSIEKVHSIADLPRSAQLQARGMLRTRDGRTALGPIFRSRTGPEPRLAWTALPVGGDSVGNDGGGPDSGAQDSGAQDSVGETGVAR